MATENTSNNDVTMTEIPEETSPDAEGFLFDDTEQQIRIVSSLIILFQLFWQCNLETD